MMRTTRGTGSSPRPRQSRQENERKWYAQRDLTLHGVAPAHVNQMLSMWNNRNRP